MVAIVREYIANDLYTREVIKDVIKVFYSDEQIVISSYSNSMLTTHAYDLAQNKVKIEIGE